jgi:phage/plasmid-like protein (TIGR03299 family)
MSTEIKTIDLTNINPSPIYKNRDFIWSDVSTSVRGINHVEAALERAGMNWKVQQEPLFLASGYKIPNRVANIRDDNMDFIEVVSNRYVPVQNVEGFQFLENVLQTGALQLENAGYFGYGRVFLLGKVEGVHHVMGETIEPYILFSNSHDGTSRIKVCMTSVRVVCRNTLALALETATRIWGARHTGTIAQQIREAQKIMQVASDYYTEFPIVAETMLEKNLTPKEIAGTLDSLFPVSKDGGKLAAANAYTKKMQVLQILALTPDLEHIKDTAWGFYNAVADYVSHEPPQRQTTGWKLNRFADIADGSSILETAQELLAAIPA